ncbi:Uncharacterised protein [Escherichia coli]|jgi:hypothetical protein|nr:hypothetical protein A1WO_04139 [Escherichia coli KTE102]EQQ73925.1 hypothetical protein G772_02520 [Escherichia coli HVH 111 (4-7039018)]ERA93531.1 hypothetical protein G877_02652 [Escherichia coli HVH 228 (4-7787030)]SQM55271.1 Uncharacterised protein [Escherichia coli]SQS97302.1 Uncharacterised protein [Escherichia coli]
MFRLMIGPVSKTAGTLYALIYEQTTCLLFFCH